MPATVKGLMLNFFIEVTKRWRFSNLKGLSLRHYDPQRNSLIADENWGCWPHYDRPQEVEVNEKSLSGRVFLNNTLEYEPDIQESELYTAEEKRRAAEQEFVSTVAIPLPWQERKIGTLQLYFTEVIEFTREAQEDAYLMARLGATVVYEWLFSQAEKEIRGAMRQTTKHRALRTFLKQLSLLFGIKRCVIYLKAKEEGQVRLEQGFPRREIKGVGQNFCLEKDLPFLARAAELGKSVFFEKSVPLLFFIQPKLTEHNSRGVIVAPISVMGEIMAYLVLDLPESHNFTEVDYSVLDLLLDSGSDLLTRFYFEEEKIKNSVLKVITSVEHEITSSLIGARANLDNPKKSKGYLEQVSHYLESTLALYRGNGLEQEPLLLDRLIEEVVGECRNMKQAEGRTIEAETERHPLLSGNRHLIRRALHNLILNGLEATDPGGWVKVCQQSEGEYAVIKVITPTEIIGVDPERVFDPAETTKRGPSRGTGLHIVDLIAAAHGGHTSLETKGGLTTFFLYLPFMKSIGK